jgi:hypothetical protein
MLEGIRGAGQRRGEIPTRVGWRGGDDEADRRGPRGGDRGRRCRPGLRKLEEETTFGKYANAAQAGMDRARARSLQGKGGAVGQARLRGWVGRLAAGPMLRKNSF